MKLLWKSANEKWKIYDDSKEKSPYVAMINVTDGWYNHYAAIDNDGRLTTGLYDTYWDYTAPVPKTIEKKAFALLRQMYIERHRKPMGKKTLPISYFVMPWANFRENKNNIPKSDYRPALKYFKTYESAYKYAAKLWRSYTPTQKKYMYLTIGRFSKTYDSVKEIPKNFSYSHVGEISKDNPLRK